MNKLQGLLGEANKLLGHKNTRLSIPIIAEGVLYQVSRMTSIETAPLTYGRAEELRQDYDLWEGIGAFVPHTAGLDDILLETNDAARKVIHITMRHARALREISALCYKYLSLNCSDMGQPLNGGLFRVHITAKSAVFQILFSMGNNMYIVGYEGSLKKLIERGIYQTPPFGRLPPEIEIADEKDGFVPTSFNGLKSMLDKTPHNAPRGKKPRFQSRTADILERFGDLVEDLLAA